MSRTTKRTSKKKINETLISKLSTMIDEKNIVPNYEPVHKILKKDNRVITHIIHMADIHIRLSSRHDEYMTVFEELYRMLREHKEVYPDSLICICGDILHSKDELKPNAVLFTWNFIKTLSDIFPVIIIIGNHDTIEMNENKIDSITSILEDRDTENIHYLSDSGCYEYNNVAFGVSSIKDKYIMHVDKMPQDMIKVGLYHGMLDGSVINEYGSRLRGTKKLADFGNYDYLLLGDVHHFQYLNKEQTAAYSSSLIAQNFSETDDKHGYLEWSILEGTSVFRRVKNEYSFYKINYDDMVIEDLGYIQKGYLRIDFHEKYSMTLKKDEVKKQINDIYPDIKVSWNVIMEEKKQTMSIEENNDSVDDLLKRYLMVNHGDLSEETLEKVMYYLTKTLHTTKTINIKYFQHDWKLVWLSFDYMYGYGKDNVIDFTLYPDREIVGIFGNNAIGKSSLIDIITFMLYSRSARDDSAHNPKDIIHTNATKAHGILVIESNGVKYMIKRVCTKKISATKALSILTKLSVYRMVPYSGNSDVVTYNLHGVEYELRTMNEDTRQDTDDILVPIIGTYDNFITTSVMLQGNKKTFSSKTNVQKKEFLSQILNLTYFRRAEEVVSERYKKYKTECMVLENVMKMTTTKSIEELEEENRNIKLDGMDLDGMKLMNMKKIEMDMIKNKTEYYEIDDNYDDIMRRIGIYNSGKNNIVRKINKLQNRFGICVDVMERLARDGVDVEYINKVIEEVDGKLDELREYELDGSEADKIRKILAKYDLPDDYEYIKNMKNGVMTLIDELGVELGKARINKKLCMDKLGNIRDMVMGGARHIDYDNLLGLYNKIRNKDKSDMYKTYQMVKSVLMSILEENIMDDIDELMDKKVKLEKNRECELYRKKEKELRVLESKYGEMTGDIGDMIKRRVDMMVKLDNNKEMIRKMITTKNRLMEIVEERDIYEILSKILGRDGIELFMLSESLDKITKRVNNILEPFIQKTLKLEMNGDKIEISVYALDGNRIHTISGMENLMMEMTLKIIINQLSVMPKSSILFIDESISVLDNNRLMMIEELFNFIRQYYSQVVLITHIRQVKNQMSYSLEIGKRGIYSEIRNI